MLGRDPYSTAYYGWDPYFGSQMLGFWFSQAYLQYAKGPVTVMGGILPTLIGYETIYPQDDTNFSRGILDGYAEPGTHLGVRGVYVMSDMWTFIAGVNNGWDNIRDYSRHKTFELGVNFTPSKIVNIALSSLLAGGQRAVDFTATGPEGTRNILDIIATLHATDKLTLVLNGDFAAQSKAIQTNQTFGHASWSGVVGYANYQFNDKWRTSLRAEFFDDPEGFRTGVAQCWKEATLTVAYAPIKSLELRAETRHDISNVNSFVNANRVSTSNDQQSYALEALYRVL